MGESRVGTVFVDLDGTLVEHNYTPQEVMDKFLPGAWEMLKRWRKEGYDIVLTTAREQRDCRMFLNALREQLSFTFDHVIEGISTGPRYLVNDRKDEQDKAFAFNIDRNEGLERLGGEWND